jgi:hypothetical protein
VLPVESLSFEVSGRKFMRPFEIQVVLPSARAICAPRRWLMPIFWRSVSVGAILPSEKFD